MKLIILKIPERLDADVFNELKDKITRKRKIDKLKLESDKYLSLFGELIIRNDINENYGIHNDDINFEYSSVGKPKVDIKDYHFNISHSGGYVLCGISQSDIGVDIEEIKDVDFRISKYVFSESEQKIIDSSEDDKTDIFYRLWTMKESYLKATGEGFNSDIKSVSFDICESNIFYDGWHIKEYDILDEYKVSVCSRDNRFVESIKTISYLDIVNCYLK